MKPPSIKIEVAVDPIPLARPRFSRGRAYLPRRSREYRQEIQRAAAAVMGTSEPMTGALSCRVQVYRRFKATAHNYGDADNHIKGVLDALNGICYRDDAQVVAVTLEKHTDKAAPRVTIELAPADTSADALGAL